MGFVFEIVGLISDLLGLSFRERLPRLRVRRALQRAVNRSIAKALNTSGGGPGAVPALRSLLAGLREDEFIDDYGNLILRDSLARRLGDTAPESFAGADPARFVRALREALLDEVGLQGGTGGALQHLHDRIQDARKSYLGPGDSGDIDFTGSGFALPVSDDAVLGREEAIADLLDHCRTAAGATVIWIHGEAGSGKTTLAVELARRLDERDGLAVPFVRLRASSRELGGGAFRDTDAHRPLADLLRRYDVVGADRLPEAELRAQWKTVVRRRDVQAIVLDDALDIGQVEPFLPGDGRCVVIVSSRVAPPGLLAHRVAIPALPIETVLRHLAGLGDGDADRIDGLIRGIAATPLAIPLIRFLDGRPEPEFGNLLEVAGAGDFEAAAHRFAVERLDADARRSLGLLAGQPGFRLTAEVLAALDRTDVDTAAARLETLTELGLLKTGSDGAYGFHDRTYLHIEAELDRYASASQRRTARLRLLRRQCDYALAVHACFDDAQGRRSRLPSSDLRLNADEARHWLTMERRNLIDALNYHREHAEPDTPTVLADLCLLIGPSLLRIGYTRDAELFLRAAVALAVELDDRLHEAEARRALGGRVLRMSDQYAEAETELAKAVELYAALGDGEGEAAARGGLGHIARLREDWDAATRHLEEAREGYSALGLDRGEAECLLGLAEIAMVRDAPAFEESFELYRQAGRLFQDHHDMRGVAESCWGRAEVARLRGELETAVRLYDAALDLARASHDQLVEADTRRGLGDLAAAEGDDAEALEHFEAAVELYRRILDHVGTADALAGKGETLLRLGRSEEAAAALGSAEELYSGIGNSHADRIRRLLRDHGLAGSEATDGRWRRFKRKDTHARG
ncbi:tetratricopeptide repeat protein [Glycomyces arizonensis]|uniref:tetratricopeptide repeat protein n=1 Tax=Glycomyces arizonensis TaxID=256035 RepID=UPI0003FF61E5|nr:tetratricopeptide repeat protein [Glycomyces arizonensis]